MSTLSLRLPDSLHKQIKKLASEDGISIKHYQKSQKVPLILSTNCSVKHLSIAYTGQS